MTSSSAATARGLPPDSVNPSRELFGHPTGLYVLFFTEMWERFSFYSMRAFLTLYMVKVMLFDQSMSTGVYGAYLGFVYATTFVGGILADRLMGQRLCILIGGLLMAGAQFTLATHAWMSAANGDPALLRKIFFVGLALLSTGNGFFKPNISTIVGSLYKQGDARRDGAFTIFYMGINIGATLAGFSGELAEKGGWHWGFIVAGVGMLIGQVIFQFGLGHLQGKGMPPRPRAVLEASPLGIPWVAIIFLGVLAFVPTAAWFMSNPKSVQNLALYIAPVVLVYLLWEAFRCESQERGRMIVAIVLCSFSMMFWAFFELAGSAVAIFADQHVNRHVAAFDWTPSASLLTAQINPMFIIIFSVPFAMLWIKLDRMRMEPSSPLKFSLGLAQLAAGFFVLYLGAREAGTGGKCALWFLVLGFLLHTTGELCLSPVGLSTITKLSPARLVGTFMGVWFLASALGNSLAGGVGEYTEKFGFGDVFKYIALISGASALALFCLTPVLKRMMHGVK